MSASAKPMRSDFDFLDYVELAINEHLKKHTGAGVERCHNTCKFLLDKVRRVRGYLQDEYSAAMMLDVEAKINFMHITDAFTRNILSNCLYLDKDLREELWGLVNAREDERPPEAQFETSPYFKVVDRKRRPIITIDPTAPLDDDQYETEPPPPPAKKKTKQAPIVLDDDDDDEEPIPGIGKPTPLRAAKFPDPDKRN